MHKKIRPASSESGYKLRTLYNEHVNLTISNAKAPFCVEKHSLGFYLDALII